MSVLKLEWKTIDGANRRHPGCTSNGVWVNVVDEGSNRVLMQAGSAHVDAPCIDRALKSQKERTTNFGLGVIRPSGREPANQIVEGMRISIPPGSYLVTNPREYTTPAPGRDQSIVQVGISQHLLREAREALGIPKAAGPFDFHRVTRRLSPAIRAPMDRIAAWLEKGQTGHRPLWLALQIQGAAWDLLAALWEEHPSGLKPRLTELGYHATLDTRLERAMAHMRTHYAQPLSNERVADAAGASAPHLFKLFRKQFRCAPQEFLRRIRVEHAERLCAEYPRMTQSEAARRVGLGSAWALTKARRRTRLPSDS